MGAGGGTWSTIRWLAGESLSPLGGKSTSPMLGLEPGVRALFEVKIDEEGRMEINHQDRRENRYVSWGVYVPGPLVASMRGGPVRFYAGAPAEMKDTWTVCQP